VCLLAPTLERGGMRGGGRYHNSVKTGIFKNSVICIYIYIWSHLKTLLSCRRWSSNEPEVSTSMSS
jgi:hypothetical protein